MKTPIESNTKRDELWAWEAILGWSIADNGTLGEEKLNRWNWLIKPR